jgi:hypothetical protein
MGIFWRGLNLGNGEEGGVADKGKIFFLFLFFFLAAVSDHARQRRTEIEAKEFDRDRGTSLDSSQKN